MSDRTLGLNAVVLYGHDIEAVAAFYRSLGVPLVEKRSGDGPAYFEGPLGGGALLVIDPGEPGRAQGRGEGGAIQISFAVASVDAAVAKATEQGASVAAQAEVTFYGRRAVVLDPEGRPVEFVETGR